MPSTLVVDNLQPRTGSTIVMPAGTSFYAPGGVVQVVNFQTGAFATGTTLIPFDNTTPQNTEGDQYMALAITPKFATSKLLINVTWMGGHSVSTAALIACLFQDSNVNALATGFQVQAGVGVVTISYNYYMTAGSTTPTTFKVRGGSNSAGTTSFNGYAGAAYFNSTLVSSMTITEIGG